MKLFSGMGYHRTSMDDIAREADVAKGTLYYHFKGKAELFETLVVDGFAQMTNTIQEALEDDAPVGEQMRIIVRKQVELFLEYSPLVHLISNELSNGIEADVLARIEAKKRAYVDFVASVLRQGAEEQWLDPLPHDLAAVGIIGLLEKICLHYSNNEGLYTREELDRTVERFVVGPLLAGHAN